MITNSRIRITKDQSTPMGQIKDLAIKGGQRGIVVSTDFVASPFPGNVLSTPSPKRITNLTTGWKKLPDQNIVYALMFWDLAAWPIQFELGIYDHSPLTKICQEEGILKLPVYNLNVVDDLSHVGERIKFGPTASEQIVAGHNKIFYGLRESSKGSWTYHHSMNDLIPRLGYESTVPGITYRLSNLLPIPGSVDDPSKFLRWREDRRHERRRFLDVLTSIAIDVASSENQKDALDRKLAELRDACETLARLEREAGFRVCFGDYTYRIALKDFSLSNFLNNSVFGAGLGVAGYYQSASLGVLAGAASTACAILSLKKEKLPDQAARDLVAPFSSFGKTLDF